MHRIKSPMSTRIAESRPGAVAIEAADHSTRPSGLGRQR